LGHIATLQTFGAPVLTGIIPARKGESTVQHNFINIGFLSNLPNRFWIDFFYVKTFLPISSLVLA
jgi:hypothetical protein